MYYDDEQFYLDLKFFISSDFKKIRDLYLYSHLLNIDLENFDKVLSECFGRSFVLFLKFVKKESFANKLVNNLNKFVQKLALKYENKTYITSKKELDDEKKTCILNRLSLFFKHKIVPCYNIDEGIGAGLVVINNYKLYDLSTSGILKEARKRVLHKIIKEIKQS